MNLNRSLDRLGSLLVKDGRKNRPVLALVYLIILFPVLVLATYVSLKTRADLTRAVWSQQLGLASLSASTLQQKLNRMTDLGVSLASRVRFRQLVAAQQWQEAVEILAAVSRDFPFVERSFLTDLDGTLMADIPAAADVRGKNFAARDWYRGVSRDWQPYISDVYQRAAPPRFNVVAAAIPIKNDDGRPIAILILQVKVDSILAWTGNIDGSGKAVAWVVDKKGQLVSRPHLDLQGNIVSMSANPAARKALNGQIGVETHGGHLLAYAPVSGFGWGVIVEEATRTAYAARDRNLAFALSTYGFIFFLNCLLAHVIVGILVRIKHAESGAARLASIVEFSDDAILSKTLQGEIVTWNRGAERMYGYSEIEMKGTSIKRVIPSDHSGEEEMILERVRRGEVIQHHETTRVKKNGDGIDVSLTVSPIYDAEGEIIGASTIAREISQRKKLERELQEKNRLLEAQFQSVQEANRFKGEFLANMSHELRTPLNAIIGFAQLMQDGKIGPVSADHQECLGDILGSGRRLLDLINDVLDLAKVDSGRMEFNPRPVHLPQLISQVRSILQSIVASKRLTVTTEISPDVEELVIDPSKLKQVFYNYLSNAIKFTPEGGQISIRAFAENADHFRLEVKDTGSGIPAERIGELFLDFNQLERGLGKKYQGMGLGLSLTKKIVEAQNGWVGVQSAPGHGSLFFAVLPRTAAQPAPAGASPQSRSRTHAGFGGERILIVEDDENDLNWLNGTLAQAGYVVDCATSGAEAVAKAQRTPYSAILLDLILPDTLGWDVLRSIRSTGANQDAPVIVVTVATEKTAAKGFALQDYLAKPVSTATLLASLRRAGVIGNGTGKTILVVDDDPAARKLAAVALESSGYQVSCHGTAVEALSGAAQQSIDAVVIDLSMPEMDGFEFLERFRKLPNYGDTPVIVWTGKNITIAEREKLKSSAHSIALKDRGGIEAVLRELRYHVGSKADTGFMEKA